MIKGFWFEITRLNSTSSLKCELKLVCGETKKIEVSVFYGNPRDWHEWTSKKPEVFDIGGLVSALVDTYTSINADKLYENESYGIFYDPTHKILKIFGYWTFIMSQLDCRLFVNELITRLELMYCE